jgi:hypothetical protein
MNLRLNETSFDPKKVVPDISQLKNIDTILMHWMSVKSADNFQIREHSWPRLFRWNASVKSQHVHTMKIHGIFPVYIH